MGNHKCVNWFWRKYNDKEYHIWADNWAFDQFERCDEEEFQTIQQMFMKLSIPLRHKDMED